LNLRGSERVLDFGSGSGVCTRHIAARLQSGGHLDCVDISRGWMQVLRRSLRRFDNVAYHLGHITQLDLPKAAYDLVVLHFVLHDIPPAEHPRLIHALVRKLKPGGRLVLRDPQGHGVDPASPIQPYSTLFGREYALFEAPNIKNEEYRRDGDILLLMLKQPEYGWLDRVYYLLGLMNTFNVVYPQLQDMDFRLDAARFDLPVYIILGRHDMNNPSQIPAEYFDLLEAPSKQLFFFEDSGHGMIWEEAALFHKIMVDTVLAGMGTCVRAQRDYTLHKHTQ